VFGKRCKSCSKSGVLPFALKVILGLEFLDSIPKFIPNPVIPNMHRDSFLDDFLIVLLDINIEHLFTILLDLDSLRSLNRQKITRRKCAKYKSGTCRRKDSIDYRFPHYTFYVIIYSSYYFSCLPMNSFTSGDLLPGLRCYYFYFYDSVGLLPRYMSRIIIEFADFSPLLPLADDAGLY
jgi:hypothetical protein